MQRHPFQRGARDLSLAMHHRQPDECAARGRIPIRRALTEQVRQEEQSACRRGARRPPVHPTPEGLRLAFPANSPASQP